MEYIAHKREDGRTQSVRAHLLGTAEGCAEFASAFDCGAIGFTTGLMHDIGKYSEAFQRRIGGADIRVDHSTAGAKEAAEQLKNVAVALSIAGHHGGMPDLGTSHDTEDATTLRGRLKRTLEAYDGYKAEVELASITPPAWAGADYTALFFFTHMLFSCLVDADYLDTERFMRGEDISRGAHSSADELLGRLSRYIDDRWKTPVGDLNRRRTEILNALREAGRAAERGLFTLTVPTGGGKTVSSVAFALEHVIRRQMSRIIYVIPYTSIIEQTQEVFSSIFGSENVVAHYGTVEYSTDENGDVNDVKKLAAENWDAPIIITTNVQFFESVFSNRPGKCRKLHNIANSVIVFDEAQMLPVALLRPCMAAVTQLVKNYGCSAVLCTATQPALDGVIRSADIAPDAVLTELCPRVKEMYEAFRRVRYEHIGKCTEDRLCELLAAEPRALMIVNTRKQAQRLYSAMPADEGTFHLSTAMCPEHRRNALSEIRGRLRRGEVCRVISTSLVEAGVDVDFPIVFRASAGLDSVIQAGGRCNREGKQTEGRVIVFDTDEPAPNAIRRNISAFERIAAIHDDVAAPEAIRDYFTTLYYIGGDSELDKKQIMRRLAAAPAYRSIAEEFRVIDNDEKMVFVPYGRGAALIAAAADAPTRSAMRGLGPYGVGVRQALFKALYDSGAVSLLGENAAVLLDGELYNPNTGLTLEASGGLGYFL